MIHVEDDIIHLSPIRKNRNSYPIKYNNYGDDSSMVLLDENHLGDTIISGNTNLSRSNILEIIDLVLSSPHINMNTFDAKYRI